MVRRAAILLAVAGCTGSIDQGEQVEGLTPQQQLAQTAWIKQALPALKSGTCDTCHAGQMTMGAPAYLAGDKDLDRRDTMVAFVPSVVSLGSPRTSPVLLKGQHEGPALSADEATGILTWITYEQGARSGGAMEISTAMVTPTPCDGDVGTPTCMTPTTFDLSTNGSAGSTVTLYTKALGADIYALQIEATAGPSGLHLVHPVFRTFPADMMGMPKPDASDQFFNVALNLPAGMKSTLAATATLPGFAMGDPMAIKFDELATSP